MTRSNYLRSQMEKDLTPAPYTGYNVEDVDETCFPEIQIDPTLTGTCNGMNGYNNSTSIPQELVYQRQSDTGMKSSHNPPARRHSETVSDLCESLNSVDFADFENIRADILSLNGSGNPIMHCPEQVFTRDKDGDTKLHDAIICLEVDKANCFINMAQSSDCRYLNIQNNIFQSPLHLAVITEQLPIVRRLIDAGADPEVQEQNGNTVLHIACGRGMLLLVETLLKNFHYQPENGIPSQYLEKRNGEGYTALHLAAIGNHLEIMKILIEKGADINAIEMKSGRTALHEAARNGNQELLEFLLGYNTCNMNAHAYDGHTPFDLARSYGNWDAAMKLAEAGAREDSDSE